MQPLQCGLRITELAFPNYEYIPACNPQGPYCVLVSFAVRLELGLPELWPCLGQHGIPAPSMTMPEAAVYKYTGPQLGQYNVGPPRQIPAMQPVTVAVGVQKPAHKHFRLRVLSPNARHHPGSLGRLNDVHFEPFRHSVVS